MDWPLTAALGSLAAVVGVVGFGAMAVMRSESPQIKRPPTPSVSLAALEPGPQFAQAVPEYVPPSVVVLAPANLAPEPARPLDLALPRLSREPPPKAAKPIVAPAPARPSPPQVARIDGVMTGGEIARIKAALKLAADQEPHWRPVEAVLRDIGKQQLAQIRNGAKPDVDSYAMQRVYWAARPLLAMLQPAQKEQVRRLARSMGYASVASLL